MDTFFGPALWAVLAVVLGLALLRAAARAGVDSRSPLVNPTS